MSDELEKVALEQATKYIDKVVDGPLGELGGVLQDQIRFWRWKNQVKMILKAKRYLEERNLEPSKIRTDILVPLLEAGADAEDETLADMFAGLLSSHLNPTTHQDVHPGYAKVLAQLSPFEAWLLQSAYLALSEADYRNRGMPIAMALEAAAKCDPPVSETVVRVSYHNLWRLGLCDRGKDPLSALNRPDWIAITPFGWSFLKACLPGEKVGTSAITPVSPTPTGRPTRPAP